ncbi:MAG TPA: DUF2378 family protein [Polyangiaceae bacterium]
MRRELRKRDLEARFTEELNDAAAKERFDSALATDWVPVGDMDRFMRTAAPLLYPGKVGALRLLGRDVAQDHLPTVYKILIRVASVQFVIEQAARIFKTYNSTGDAHTEKRPGVKNSVDLVITDYPEMNGPLRESGAGFIIGTLELVGAKDVRVIIDDANPRRWVFHVTWR